MDYPKSAVFFFEEDIAIAEHAKPLMLETVLFCPILKWMSDKLLANGVERFFVVSSPRFAEEARACFPAEADVTVSEQQSELMAFLNNPDLVQVFTRAALPLDEAGQGFVYAAPGYEQLRMKGLEKQTVYKLLSREQSVRVGPFGGLLKHITPVSIDPNGLLLRAADRHYTLPDGTEGFTATGSALCAGVMLSQLFAGTGYAKNIRVQGDFASNVYVVTPVEE